MAARVHTSLAARSASAASFAGNGGAGAAFFFLGGATLAVASLQ